MNPLLVGLGLGMPGRTELIELGIATVLAVLCLAAGLLAGRLWGDRLEAFWREHAVAQVEGLGVRLGAIVRHGVAALLLAVALSVWPWTPLAAFAIGFALAAAVARGAVQLLRGLGIQRWLALGVATVLFVALLGNALGGLEPITSTLERIGFNIGKRRLSVLTLITMVMTAVALFAAVRLVNRVLSHSIARARDLDATQKLLAQKLASIAVVVIAFFLGIDLLGIDLTAFAVFSGAFGLAVGFGFQKTFGNLIAGIILLLDRSIKPGDVIVVGTSFGWVNKIGVRAVSVITRDGKEHLIPNENLMTQEVENWSFSSRNVRVRIPVAVSYDCDLELAQRLMHQAAAESSRVLNDPPPNVWLTALGENAAEHEILAWIADPEAGVGNVKSDVLNRLWRLFKQHGIVVPPPRRDIRLRPFPEPAPEA